jgi:hypothetical protein
MGAVCSTDYNEFLHTKEEKGNAALVSCFFSRNEGGLY